MPRLRKYILNNHVYFVTLSVEEGILLPANPLVTFLLKAALLRAYEHHQLEINHFIVNGTHIHMIVRVDNPEDLPKFMERFKTESAHYLNRLLGRKKRTVWCERYDSQMQLEVGDVIDKIVYLYTNPVKDGLISSIKKYPGFSSYKNFIYEHTQVKGLLISRDALCKVNQNIGYNGFSKIAKKLSLSNPNKSKLRIYPNGWLKAFDITDKKAIAEINEIIHECITNEERKIKDEKEKFMGRVKLENQGMVLNYIPERSGKKVWCTSSNRKKRIKFIAYVKMICEEAREVYEKHKQGDFSVKYPPGIFAPPLPLSANAVAIG